MTARFFQTDVLVFEREEIEQKKATDLVTNRYHNKDSNLARSMPLTNEAILRDWLTVII